MSLRGFAGFVRRVAADLARVAGAVEMLTLPTALLEVHAGQIVARCSCCRQVTRLAVNGELARIAEVLVARPDLDTRTWQSHESVADLERENREHGLPVPGDEPDTPSAGAPVPIRPHPPAGPAEAHAVMVDDLIDPVSYTARSLEGGSG